MDNQQLQKENETLKSKITQLEKKLNSIEQSQQQKSKFK